MWDHGTLPWLLVGFQGGEEQIKTAISVPFSILVFSDSMYMLEIKESDSGGKANKELLDLAGNIWEYHYISIL